MDSYLDNIQYLNRLLDHFPSKAGETIDTTIQEQGNGPPPYYWLPVINEVMNKALSDLDTKFDLFLKFIRHLPVMFVYYF